MLSTFIAAQVSSSFNMARAAASAFILYRATRWTGDLYQAAGDSRWWNVVGTMFVVLFIFYLLFPSLVFIIISFSAGQLSDSCSQAFCSGLPRRFWTSAG
ncbi:hypothetical protein [Bradyrhizobium sp. USDA 4518]